jgi:hypothetical protein
MILHFRFQLPYFFIEDVFIAGWIGERCAVPKHHLPGFTMFRPNKPIRKFDKDADLLVHYVDKVPILLNSFGSNLPTDKTLYPGGIQTRVVSFLGRL